MAIAQGFATQALAAQTGHGGDTGTGCTRVWGACHATRTTAGALAADASPTYWQIRNGIDLARMRAAIRVFNEKTALGSNEMVEEWELQAIVGADFPSAAELEAAETTGAVA